jgi:predicted DCC family thiol-disulfide oxidoreductase YuxK
MLNTVPQCWSPPNDSWNGLEADLRFYRIGGLRRPIDAYFLISIGNRDSDLKIPLSEKTTVFYDGACPLCQREIAFYRACKGAESVRWIDVSQSSRKYAAPGLTRQGALARFHVQTADGRLVTGASAFAHLWTVLPGSCYLGHFFQLPLLRSVLDGIYDLFLRIRPYLKSRRWG